MSGHASRGGQLLVEVLIGVALAAIFIIGAASIIGPALQTGKQVTQVQVKTELAKELIDNVKSFASGNWNSVLALATGTANKYYLNTLTSPFTAATTTSGEAVTVCSGASSGSGANGYSYTRAITVSAAQVSSTDQTNFPMLVSGTYSYLATAANGGKVTNANGYDIIFTSDSAGNTPLPFEQESYSSSTGAVNYWVNVPTLSHSVTTTIYMWYGNTSITTSQSNKTGTWDSNFVGVYHFPNGTTLSGNDSTVSGNNSTANGTTAGVGIADGAASFNGTSNYMSTTQFNNVPSSNLTVCSWIKTSASSGEHYVFSLGRTASNNSNEGIFEMNNGKMLFWDYNGSYGFDSATQSNTSVADNNWHFVCFTKNGTAGTYYTDGHQDGTKTAAINQTYNGAIPSYFGANVRDGNSYWSGSMDDLAISNTTRSGGWIATEYNNQNSPSTFYSIGAESTGNGLASTGACPTYNRYFYVSDIYRDSSGNATTSASGNFYDPSVKQVTAVVSAATGPSTPVTYTLYVFRNSGNAFNQGSWLGGSGQNGALTFVTTTYASSTNILVNATGSLQLSGGGGSSCVVTSLTGYWKFDEGTSISANDSSGMGNLGVWYGTQASPSGTYYSAPGEIGAYAGYFNGTDDFVQTPEQSISGAITVAAWVYSSNFVQSGFIIGKNPVNTQWELFFDSGGLMYWRGGSATAVTHAPPSNNAWHYVAATQSSTLATLYIDGTAVASGTVTAIANGTSSVNNTIEIGRFNSGYYFNGKIDEVRLYSRALTAQEIQTLYSGGSVY